MPASVGKELDVCCAKQQNRHLSPRCVNITWFSANSLAKHWNILVVKVMSYYMMQ